MGKWGSEWIRVGGCPGPTRGERPCVYIYLFYLTNAVVCRKQPLNRPMTGELQLKPRQRTLTIKPVVIRGSREL